MNVYYHLNIFKYTFKCNKSNFWLFECYICLFRDIVLKTNKENSVLGTEISEKGRQR